MKYFRVKHGYGKDDFLSVDENDLPKAFLAQISGKVFAASDGSGSIRGNDIISILPDYNRALGLNRDYVLNGEDYTQLGNQSVLEHRKILEGAKNSVNGAMTKQLGT